MAIVNVLEDLGTLSILIAIFKNGNFDDYFGKQQVKL